MTVPFSQPAMDAQADTEQTRTMLRHSVQAFNERAPGAARTRAVRGASPHLDRNAWRQMADAGWLGVLVPEEQGGIGLGYADAAVLCQELGAGLAPEPFIASALLVTSVLAQCSGGQAAPLLSTVMDGSCVAALAWQSSGNDYTLDAAAVTLSASGGLWCLDGTRSNVQLAAAADGFLVLAAQEGEPVLIWVDAKSSGVHLTSTRSVDGLSSATVRFEQVQLAHGPLASGGALLALLAQALEAARVMTCFELLGVMDNALQATIAYCKQRVQFGRAIGSFQVLQHRMVDMWIQAQLAHASAAQALRVLERDGGSDLLASLTLAASAAKARASQSAQFIGRNAIQLHGAMGIADETDIGLCLKRAVALSAWLGNAAAQRRRHLTQVLAQRKIAVAGVTTQGTDTAAALTAAGIDMDALPDDVFRARLSAWVASNYPEHKRYMKKRAFFSDIGDWYMALSRQGWLAPAWPKQYGGMGLSAAKQVIYYEVMAAHGCARIPDHGLMVGQLLLQHGSEQQIAEHLPRVLNGEVMWCQGYSEPNAGSDLASLRTRAVAEGDELVVNGQKIWTTLASGAQWIFTLVRTADAGPSRQHGITFLLIDLATPGVQVRPILNIKGEEEFCEVFFDDVRVPKANVVGRIDQGWSVANSLLRHERIFFGTPRQCDYALGQLSRLAEATGALEDAAFADRYASLLLDVADLKAAFESFVSRLRDGEELGSEVSYLKIWSTETFQRITDELVSQAGDDGACMDDITVNGRQVDVMNQYLDSRAPTIFSGSNEIQRNILAKQVLGLPSSDSARIAAA